MLEWGLPYFIGRIYLGNFKWMRELAIAIFIGGLVYVPLCIYEMKFSPILHMQVYGFAQNSIAQQIRLGGWRPMVFLPHGIAVGLFMSAGIAGGIVAVVQRVADAAGGRADAVLPGHFVDHDRVLPLDGFAHAAGGGDGGDLCSAAGAAKCACW